MPNRVLNNRQKYLLNKSTLDRLHNDIDAICKRARIPKWFMEDDKIYVSLEMIEVLLSAIKFVTKKDISPKELCVNYDGTKKSSKKCTKSITKKKEKNMVAINSKKEVVADLKVVDDKKTISDLVKKDDVVVNDAISTEEATKVVEERQQPTYPRSKHDNNQQHSKSNNNYNNRSNYTLKEIANMVKKLSNDDLDKLKAYIEEYSKFKDFESKLFD